MYNSSGCGCGKKQSSYDAKAKEEQENLAISSLEQMVQRAEYAANRVEYAMKRMEHMAYVSQMDEDDWEWEEEEDDVYVSNQSHAKGLGLKKGKGHHFRGPKRAVHHRSPYVRHGYGALSCDEPYRLCNTDPAAAAYACGPRDYYGYLG